MMKQTTKDKLLQMSAMLEEMMNELPALEMASVFAGLGVALGMNFDQCGELKKPITTPLPDDDGELLLLGMHCLAEYARRQDDDWSGE